MVVGGESCMGGEKTHDSTPHVPGSACTQVRCHWRATTTTLQVGCYSFAKLGFVFCRTAIICASIVSSRCCSRAPHRTLTA